MENPFTSRELRITRRLTGRAASLLCPSSHWRLSAVKWIENGFPIKMMICSELEDISLNKIDSQQLRQKAVNLANKWKQKNGTQQNAFVSRLA